MSTPPLPTHTRPIGKGRGHITGGFGSGVCVCVCVCMRACGGGWLRKCNILALWSDRVWDSECVHSSSINTPSSSMWFYVPMECHLISRYHWCLMPSGHPTCFDGQAEKGGREGEREGRREGRREGGREGGGGREGEGEGVLAPP